MKSILLYCNWGVFIDECGCTWVSSIHAQYIYALKNIGYTKVTLISKVSSSRKASMDMKLDAQELEVISLPNFSSYLSGVLRLPDFVKVFFNLRAKDFDRVYIRTFEPYGWLLAVLLHKSSLSRDRIVFHFISDPKTAIYVNSAHSTWIKHLRYAAFLPEYFLTVFVATLFSSTSNGPVPKRRVPRFLGKKMKVVIESALLEKDIPLATSNEARRKDGVFNLLYVGYIRPSKGIDVLVAAMGVLKSRGIDNIKLYLVGDGEYRDRISELIIDHKVSDLVVLVGYVPFSERLFDFYRKGDVFLNLSRSETGPRVVLEARMFGCYIVTTDVGYCKNIVKTPADGIFVDGINPYEVADAVEEHLKASTEKSVNFNEPWDGKSYSLESFFKGVLNET